MNKLINKNLRKKDNKHIKFKQMFKKGKGKMKVTIKKVR